MVNTMAIKLYDYLCSTKTKDLEKLDWALIENMIVNGHRKTGWFGRVTIEPCQIFRSHVLKECDRLKISDRFISVILKQAAGKIISREVPMLMVAQGEKSKAEVLDTFFANLIGLRLNHNSKLLGELIEGANGNGFTETKKKLSSYVEKFILETKKENKLSESSKEITKILSDIKDPVEISKILVFIIDKLTEEEIGKLSLHKTQILLEAIKRDPDSPVGKFIATNHTDSQDIDALTSYYATQYLSSGKLEKFVGDLGKEQNGNGRSPQQETQQDESNAQFLKSQADKANINGINSQNAAPRINLVKKEIQYDDKKFQEYLISKLKLSKSLKEFREEYFNTDEDDPTFKPAIYDDFKILFYSLSGGDMKEYMQKTFIPKRCKNTGFQTDFDTVLKYFVSTFERGDFTKHVGNEDGSEGMLLLDFVADDITFFKAILERGLDIGFYSENSFELVFKQALAENNPEVIHYLLNEQDKVAWNWAEVLKHGANYGTTEAFKVYIKSDEPIVTKAFGRQGKTEEANTAKYTILNLILDSLGVEMIALATLKPGKTELMEDGINRCNSRIECLKILLNSDKAYINSPEAINQLDIAKRTISLLKTISKKMSDLSDLDDTHPLKHSMNKLYESSEFISNTVIESYDNMKNDLDLKIGLEFQKYSAGLAKTEAGTYVSGFTNFRNAPDNYQDAVFKDPDLMGLSEDPAE